MDNIIEIKEEDLPSHLSRFKESAEKTDVLLDPDKNLWISLGVPVQDKKSSDLKIAIPDKPHVFMAHNLWVNDKKHQNMLLVDVPIIFAHGYRDGEIWKFANGQPVVDTVNAYDEYARLNNLPAIEVVVSCNKDMEPNPLGIKIKDFPKNKIIAQSVGDYAIFYPGHESEMSTDGKVTMTIGVDDGEFWGLDELADFKDTSRKIKIID